MSWIDSLKPQFGFDQIAWVPLSSPKTFHFYQEWLDQGKFGEMSYLHRHAPQKKSPATLLEGAQSVVMVTKSYVPAQRPHAVFKNLRAASYAQNQDYHHWFYKDLELAAEKIREAHPGAKTLVGTDSLAFLERDFGTQAGLGWVGKNTCLIDPKKGSFFFLGEILTTWPVAENSIAPIPDFCGTCTKCLEICPTGAIESPRRLNATKCISYWTIEAKGLAPLDLRERFGDWFFGCDLCQSVCPWNQKPFKGEKALETSFQLPGSPELAQDLKQILTLSDEELKTLIKGTPFERSKPFGLRRNALYVIGNRAMKELKEEVLQHQNNEKLAPLVAWTLEKLNA